MNRTALSASLISGAIYFSIVFAAGFVLGTLRVLVVIPRLGETPAVLIELPIMLAVSWVVCGWVLKTCPVPTHFPPRLLMGGFAFALLMAAELALSVFAFGRTASEHFATYQAVNAQLGLAMQIIFAAFPAIRVQSSR
jgi:hypothetical protein